MMILTHLQVSVNDGAVDDWTISAGLSNKVLDRSK